MELRWGGWRNEESERILEMLMAFEHGFFFFLNKAGRRGRISCVLFPSMSLCGW